MRKIFFAGLIAVLLLTGCNQKPKLIMTHNYSTDNIKTETVLDFNVTSDISHGSGINYQWDATSGTIVSSSGPSMKWKAPVKPGSAIVSVQVSSKEISGPLTITREIQVISAPKITSYSKVDSAEVGKETTLSIVVEDLDTPSNELTSVALN